MNNAIDIVIENQNKYRLAWIDTLTGKINKGEFLFATPQESVSTISAVRNEFPTYHVWLEDRECNKVDPCIERIS